MPVLASASAVSPKSPAGTISLEIQPSRIAIIDDDELNVELIQLRLAKLGFRQILGLTDPTQAIAALEEFQPDVVLLDVVMPEISGPELLRRMRSHPGLHDIPVITLTASRDRSTRLEVIELGVSDLLNKPVDELELSMRLRNVIEAKRYREQLSQSAEELERAVQKRTRQLEAAHRDVMQCLARAAEYRDDATGWHVIRVGRYASILAAEMGAPAEFVGMIGSAAQLHDVGKIGTPDAVLHKPGALTAEEMATMRCHSDIGWKILAPMTESRTGDPHNPAGESVSPLLLMAARIAHSHHERWDGAGYPQGLHGVEIPLEARITAVADVFDALSTPRCYKPAFELQKCFDIVQGDRGRHFDPQVVDAFLTAKDRFIAVFQEFMECEVSP